MSERTPTWFRVEDGVVVGLVTSPDSPGEGWQVWEGAGNGIGRFWVANGKKGWKPPPADDGEVG